MKNKLIVAVALVMLMVIGMSGSLSLKLGKQRYHQHMEQPAGMPLADTAGIDASTYAPNSVQQEGFVSHLPIITMDTHGQQMAGVDRTDYSRVRVTMRFYDVDGSGLETNTLDRKPDVETFVNVRYRGNSSRLFAKKGYSLRLVEPDGEENPQVLFGMASHNQWALHAPYMDKTLIRNYMMYNLSGQIMDWAPNVRFCELFVDGEYMGLFLLVEQISISTNRINLRQSDPKDPFTSYMVEIVSAHRMQPGNSIGLENFSHYAGILPSMRRFEVIYPSVGSITEEQIEYIQNDISDFERMLYSYDYDDTYLGYRNKINLDSFVEYIILNEISMNYDAGQLSTFIYKDARGDFNICVWDFNNVFDNYFRAMDAEDFFFRSRLWFEMFLKDEQFVDRLVARYKELRQSYLSDEYLLAYINDTIAYLGPAIERNYTVWGTAFLPENGLQRPPQRNLQLTTYNDAVQQMKDVLLQRSAFMDKNIESYYQFCHDSKVKPYNL